MKLRKSNLIALLILMLTSTVNAAVQVVDTTAQQAQQAQQMPDKISVIGGVTINWTAITSVLIIGSIVTVFILIVMWLITKIIKKIRASKKGKDDLELTKYNLDLKSCQMNKNSNYKHKSMWWLWLLFYRAKVYARTSEGRKFVGFYDGECTKKEGYFIMAIELRHTFFNRETDLVLFPFNLKKSLVFFNNDGSIDLECEGIDEVLSSQYFSIPVFKDVSDSKKKKIFVDFSDDIRNNYFENYAYRDVLKENIKEFAENVKEATEMNSTITLGRKTSNDLNN